MEYLRKFKIFRYILDLSLFWKIGFIIGCCVLINTVIAFYFYTKLNFLKNYFQKTPFYAYKSLAQEGLFLSEKWEKLPSQTAERLLLEASIKELARIGLKGGVYEREGQELIRIYKPTSDPEVRAALTTIISPSSIPEARKNWERVLKWAINQEEAFQKTLEALSQKTDYFYVLLFMVLGFFLLWGAFAFFFMVKRPLDKIVSQIQGLLIKGEDLYENPEAFELKYYANDEIGRLSSAVRDLVYAHGDLRRFKHIIEEDQTIEEVYERLAEVFKTQLELKNFVFFEVSNSQNTMRVMQLSDPDIEVNPEKLFKADLCRAKRTGHVVSSIGQPGVCRLFLWKEEAEHYCVPFMSGGQCVGVAQIILPKTLETRKSKKISDKLKLAERYIQEAVPVIEAKRYAESLKEQTLKDPLTGLYNRRFLEEALDNIVAGILRRETVLGILMADLDYFKSVNDKYGHDVGDKVLKETAQILKTNVRASDLVVRFGGEEFLILLVDVKAGESVRIAEKLRRLVEAHKFETPKGLLQRTISIGVSEFPTDAQGPWEAIKYADVALYQAKERGRNRVVRFTPDMWPSEEY